MSAFLQSAWHVSRGVIVTFALWVVFGLLFFVAIQWGLVSATVMRASAPPPEWHLAISVIGLVACIAGGWNAARLAGRAHVAHAAAVGLVLALFGLGVAVLTRTPTTDLDIALNVLSLHMASIGGLIAWARARPQPSV